MSAGLLDEHIAYVTSDQAFYDAVRPVLRRCSRELPYREKLLGAALRERDIGRLTIKKRGVDVAPDELRKRFSLHGDAGGRPSS